MRTSTAENEVEIQGSYMFVRSGRGFRGRKTQERKGPGFVAGVVSSLLAALAIAVVATPASAEIAVNIAGSGSGAVISSPAGEDRTFTTGSAPLGECANEARRQEQGIAALLLPDCMALEMVSPPRKTGQPAKYPNVSADGSRVTYLSAAALGEDPPALFPTTIYVAGRGGSGWTSESTIPDRDFTYLWETSSALRPSFTPDFSRWFGIGMTEAQVPLGVGQVYEGGLGGFFRPLSEPLVPLSFSVSKVPLEVISLSVFQGASADRSHLYFRAGGRATYFPGDPSPGGPGAEPANVYLARSDAGGELALELLQRDRTGKVWGGKCGARLGGIGSVAFGAPAPNGERNQGAVSVDGARTYFSARASQPPSGNCEESSKLRILERLETPAGPQIAPLFSSECTRPSLPDPPGPCKELSGDDLYQGASLDQTKVYFTTNRQLANSDLDGTNAQCSVLSAIAGCDLYLYDRTMPAGERLVQVSAGEDVLGKHEAGKEADVYNGVTAISADGSHVYFVAAGVLTGDTNPEGEGAQPGQPNLYLWDAGSEGTAFLGTLDPGDAISTDAGNGLWGGQGTWRNNAYPVPVLSPAEQGGERGEEGDDGHILVFESRAELTPSDGDGHHLDVYHYDAAGPSLQCLSCAPGSSASEPDEAPVDVNDRGEHAPLGTDFAESRRWASEDGEAVGFVTPEGLLPGDVDGAIDGHLWRQGSLVRLPGTPFIDATTAGPFLSHDGSTVAFATATPLLPQDGDTAADVYVARVGGGYPNPPAPNPCEPGNPSRECQEGQASPPAPQAGSEAVEAGNPPLQPRRCGKGKVRRHGRCVPRHRHRHAGKRRHTRQTDAHRRAAK
jgi:hypothetical protein